ncbi:MAG TPA: hypothetical protein VIE65_02175 [Methylobacter sp.]|jgi:hypothetical protein
MKEPALFFLLMMLSCSKMLYAANDGVKLSLTPAMPTLAKAKTGVELIFPTDGDPSRLRLENGKLFFCDKRGERKLDLKMVRDSALNDTCPSNDEPNTSCGGLSFDVTVRASLSEPNDIVDVNGWSIPLKGRVHDCATDGKVLAIVTASIVILIDLEKTTTKEISLQGGDRVIIESGWVAWSKGSELRVMSQAACLYPTLLTPLRKGD